MVLLFSMSLDGLCGRSFVVLFPRVLPRLWMDGHEFVEVLKDMDDFRCCS